MLTATKIVRAREWYDTKLITLLSIYLIYAKQASLFSTILVWVFLAVSLSLGFVINNLSDRKIDVKVSKSHTYMPKGVATMATTVAVTTLLALSWGFGKEISVVGTVGCLLIGISYSLKPLRLKERGFIGVVVGSLGQRILPIIPILPTVQMSSESYLMLVAIFFTGLRTMLIHQIKDYAEDKASDVQTFVTMWGRQETIQMVKSFVLPSELVLWAAWALLRQSLFLTVAFLLLVFIQSGRNKETGIVGVSDTKFELSSFYYFALPLYAVYTLEMPEMESVILLLVVLFHQKFYLKALSEAVK